MNRTYSNSYEPMGNISNLKILQVRMCIISMQMSIKVNKISFNKPPS